MYFKRKLDITLNINVVMGISSAGKSTYIKENKKKEDHIFDFLDYQNKFGINYRALYIFFADIEEYINRCHSEKENIWIEYIFANRMRRNWAYNILKVIISKFPEDDIKLNLIWIDTDLQNYLKHYSKRFPNEKFSDSIKMGYECSHKEILSENPMKDKIGWDNITKIEL